MRSRKRRDHVLGRARDGRLAVDRSVVDASSISSWPSRTMATIFQRGACVAQRDCARARSDSSAKANSFESATTGIELAEIVEQHRAGRQRQRARRALAGSVDA